MGVVRRWALVMAATTLLVGGIAASNLVESPSGSGHTFLIAEQKPSGCSSPLVARPINKTGVEYKGFAPGDGSVNVSLRAALTDVWNFGGAKMWIVRVPGVWGMEQGGPNRGAFSVWKKMNPIARVISKRCQIGREIAVIFRNVIDRVNFETPIALESGLPSRIDDSHLYIHWFCGDEDAMIRSIYSHPGPVCGNCGPSGVVELPIEYHRGDSSQTSGYGGGDHANLFQRCAAFVVAILLLAIGVCFVTYGFQVGSYNSNIGALNILLAVIPIVVSTWLFFYSVTGAPLFHYH